MQWQSCMLAKKEKRMKEEIRGQILKIRMSLRGEQLGAVRTVGNFVLEVVEQDRYRAGICELNGNGIRGIMWSWALITLSLWVFTVSICTFSFDINIFIIHPKRAVGKECKLGILAPSFEMIQYTVVSLYYLSPLSEDNVEVSSESILQALWILPTGSCPGRSKPHFEVHTCISTCCSHDGTECCGRNDLLIYQVFSSEGTGNSLLMRHDSKKKLSLCYGFFPSYSKGVIFAEYFF